MLPSSSSLPGARPAALLPAKGALAVELEQRPRISDQVAVFMIVLGTIALVEFRVHIVIMEALGL